MRFTGYTRDAGLAQSKVYTIVQDKKGFMWFGTQEGLSRFDGYRMKTFRHIPENENSLGGLSVFASMLDSSGCLWFGSEKGIVSRYDPVSDVFLRLNVTAPEDSKEIFISSFCEDSSGNIFAGSYGGGLILITNAIARGEAASPEVISLGGISENISCICFDKEGSLYAGTSDEGLFKVMTGRSKSGGSTVDIRRISGLTGEALRCLYCDTAGRIIAGTTTGLNIISAGGAVRQFTADGEPESLSYNVVTSIAEDKDRRLWAGTRNGGVNLLDERHGRFTKFMLAKDDPYSLSDNSVHSLFIDRTNVLWVGTVSTGICKCDLDSKPFRNPSETNEQFRSVKNVNAVFRDEHSNIYIGTHNRGLIIADGSFQDMKQYHRKQLDSSLAFPGNSIYSIIQSHDGKIWIGASGSGLVKFDRSRGKFSVIDDKGDERKKNVFSVCIDPLRSGSLFAGTVNGGMFEFDTEKEAYAETPLTALVEASVSNSLIKTIFCDRSGAVWFSASNTGLMKIESTRNKIVRMSEADERFSGNIRCIAEDQSGRIVICTALHGLLVLDETAGTVCAYEESDGLASNSTVSAAVEASGILWVCTINGLSKIEPDTGKITNYYESDNLLDREFNEGAIFKDTNGMIFVGSAGGLNYFYPTEVLDNPNRPEIAITDFQIFNRSVQPRDESNSILSPVEYADEAFLTYRQSVFSFEFASLIYNDSAKNRYAYILEGFDKDWNYCGTRRFATYTNIEPGEYVFKVKGTNNDGVWCSEPAVLNLKISPPFWETWWFRTAGAITAALAAGAVYKSKMNRIQKEKEVQDEFSKKLIESQEAERKRIASELHDTIAHDILILKNKAFLGITKEDHPEKLKDVLKEISDLSSDALGDVRNISYNLHPHKIERLGLTKAIASMLNLAEQSSGIKIDASLDNIDGMFGKDLELNVYRILQELVNNIIKHSKAKNAVFEISAGSSNVYLNVSDDGEGIRDPDSAEKGSSGLGLMSISTRLRLYGGRMEIKAPEYGGTSIRIIIPQKTKEDENSRQSKTDNS
ncbi:MAG: hypothetical protein K1X85_10625 [Ignavibacteria bacterium]|nr:hypothetical protein [Ignavibacteria bacterium]